MKVFIAHLLAWKRQATLTAGAVLAIWLLAWAAVPPLLKSQVESRGSEALGRQLTVGRIDFKPWSLELTLTDLAIASTDGTARPFKVARVYVDAELESLLRLAPVVDAVTIDAPQIQLTHLGEGRYDFDDIVLRLGKPSPEPAGAAPRFALHNVTLNGGEVDFVDQAGATERRHAVRKLHVAIPFLSNLPSQRQVHVTPRLAFDLNGSAFDTAADGTPFAQTRKGEAALRIARLDVAPYLSYWPKGLPVQLTSAVLDTDLRIAFEQTPQVAVSVKGQASLSALALRDGAGKDLLGVQSIRAVLADVRPLEKIVKLESLDVTAPSLQVRRNAAGKLNLDPGGAADAQGAPGPQGGGWKFAVERFALHAGTVGWSDESVAPKVQMALTSVALQAQSMAWPFGDAPASFEGSLAVPSRSKPAQLAFKGSGTDAVGTVQATLKDVSLGLAAPYAARYLVPQVAGVLEGTVDAQWKGAQVQVAVQRLALHDVGLLADKPASTGKVAGSEPPVAMPRFKLLEVTQARVDLANQSVQAGKVLLRAPSATVARDAQGVWMFERWLKPVALGTDAAAPTPPSAPWKVTVAEVLVDDGAVTLDDRLPSRPVSATVSALKVQLKSAALDGKTPAPLSVSARIKAGQTEPGTVKYNGTVMWAPLAAQGTLEALLIPAHAFMPYVADRLNIDVLRADTSVKGAVHYAAKPAGPELQLKLDAALDDFASNSLPTRGAQGLQASEELLRWKSLHIPGIEVAMVPGAPLQVQVREVALTDFYARLIVNPQGRLNLQDLVRSEVAPAQSAAAAAPAASAPEPTQVKAASAPAIAIGPISLVHGKVQFSDYFIKPNYSADLSGLTGKLSKFSSQPVDGVVQLADLELRGRAEGSASLEITGKANPLARPLALDIKGKVRDLELPPLSPYAIKYAGYGIERGKLSLDVGYLVQPDGQLTATNSLVLNQLTFGEKVEGAPNSLPVKLAVSLLSDSNGVIDLNLPISGSLNDPQFSIGPVIWKIVVNVITKALTAPFSLLANAFGGGEELGNVSFAPGSSTLSPEAKLGLDKVAKALTERTGLKLTVQGTSSLERERDALQRERLKGMVLAEKRRRAAVAGQNSATVVSVSEAEYPVLLKEVYKRADIAKPRNLVGFAKDLPQTEMEALLLAHITVNEDAMRELALERGVVVRDYLAGKKLETERLFLGAAKTLLPQTDWRPRAELSLTSR